MNDRAGLIRACYVPIPFLVFLSCSLQRQDDRIAYSEFSVLDSLELVVSSPFLQHTNWTTYDRASGKVLVEYGLDDEGNLIIHQVDFERKAYLAPILINRDGPNGYNSSNASVFFKNKDSIYVFPAARNHFWLYTGLGMKIKAYSYGSTSYERYYKNGYYSSLIHYSDSLVLTTINNTRYNDPAYFDKVYPVQTYNLKKSEFSRLMPYPKFVRGKHIPSNLTGAMLYPIDAHQFIVNYSFSDSIYVYNVDTGNTEAIYCGAQNFGKPRLLTKVPNKLEELEYHLKEVNYELVFFNMGKVYRVVSHLPKSYQNYSIPEIVNRNLRRVLLIEMDISTRKLRFYRMPIAKYFLFDKDHLIVGGVSVREYEGETLRKFYKYRLLN